jgi:phage terminase small subunit
MERSPKKSESNTPKRRPNPKVRRFVKGLMGGKSTRRAALDAGYTQNMADKAGEKIMPNAIAEFRAELRKRISLTKLSQRIAEGLDAKETKLAQHKGKFTGRRDLVAFGERREYTELAARLMGLADEKVEIDTRGPLEVIVRHIGSELPPPKEPPSE